VTFDPDLLDALEACVVDRIEGTAWRQVLAPTSVLRANLRGARWNPPGTETLYCSLDPETAAAEIDALLAAQPIPITRTRFTYPIQVELSKVADLRTSPWGTTFDHDYDTEDASACQLIGAAASWLAISGLLVPSLRSHGDNLVIFVSNQGTDDSLDPGAAFDFPPGPPPNHGLLPVRPM
jgi:RES domain-containing protein